jgi:DNA-binding SARP family transcriptional activator
VGTGLKFGILGPLEVRVGGTLVRVGGPRQRALLALLLCSANRVVSRDQLIDELLSGQPAGSAERMLRVQISRLRKVLADGDAVPRLLARPPGYMLRVEDGELDLHAFEQRVDAGRRAFEQGDPGQAAVLLRQAESLWRGRPLADPEFESFARFEAQRLAGPPVTVCGATGCTQQQPHASTSVYITAGWASAASMPKVPHSSGGAAASGSNGSGPGPATAPTPTTTTSKP